MAEQTIMTEQLPPEKPRSKCGKIAFFLLFLLIISIAAAAGYGYICLLKKNKALNSTVTDLQTQAKSNRDDIDTLQHSLQNVTQMTDKAQELANQQAQMMSDWKATQKGDLEKWYVAEAQYLVKLANDHLQFTHDVSMALVLLQRADQVLQNLDGSNLIDLRKSLTADITALQANPQTDLTNIYLKVNALNMQVDNLPLPSTPLPEIDAVSTVKTDGLPWWKAGMQRSWAALKQIVIVRKTGNTLPLVLPDEKLFLYQNLHAQLENAQWAVLHRNADVYNASLDRAIIWTQLYFDQEATPTKAALQSLQDLRKMDISTPKADFSQTLKLFDNYIAVNGSVTQ